MTFPATGKVWMNGSLVDWADATIHVASHVIHYGSGVFEGIRCYDTPKGSAVFRLDAHIRRLFDSARIYRMESTTAPDAIERAVLETVTANRYPACYIRPIMYRGYGALGVNPFPCPVDTAILVWEWGQYLGSDSLEHGVDVKVSTWARSSPNSLPSLAKSTANYANAQLIKMEAIVEGYAEAIALDAFGNISEGSGENVFVVRDNVMYTPPISASVLPGITRDSVIRLGRDLGYEVREQVLPRELLYIADEVFFTGTAVEITPVRSIDRIQIGSGARGPVTHAVQRAFFDIVNGAVADRHRWLRFVDPERAARQEPARARVKAV